MREFTGLVPTYFDGPVIFFRLCFSLFPKEIRFPVKKKKKKKRRRKKKLCRGAAGAEEKNIFYYFFFFDFFFGK